MHTSQNISVIGAGFAGLASAATLASQGHTVVVHEKNGSPGGRGRAFSAQGYLFDMGPSWYWMPDIFDDFFASVGEQVSDHYTLEKLDPAFRMVFPEGETLDVPGEQEALIALFESIERGAGERLRKFMSEAALKYEIGVKRLAFKPSKSLLEFVDLPLLKNLHKLHLFKRFDRYVGSFFKDQKIRRLMEFPILFLGTLPQTTPALYSFMNYGGLCGGTWYPRGGMIEIGRALERICQKKGVEIRYDDPVECIEVRGKRVVGVASSSGARAVDGLVAAADYHHVEQGLLAPEHRKYSAAYWEKRTLAPSSLIFYLGVKKRLPGLLHHTLFFDTDFEAHANALYERPAWPTDPLFYVCCPSKTDASVAPAGNENLFILVPLAAGLEDTQAKRDALFARVIERIERFVGESFDSEIEYARSYCVNDFMSDYNSLRGNAYGLANTLMQTAIGKPQLVSSTVERLVYAGQLTVPGPGVPPSFISGQIAAKELQAQL